MEFILREQDLFLSITSDGIDLRYVREKYRITRPVDGFIQFLKQILRENGYKIVKKFGKFSGISASFGGKEIGGELVCEFSGSKLARIFLECWDGQLKVSFVSEGEAVKCEVMEGGKHILAVDFGVSSRAFEDFERELKLNIRRDWAKRKEGGYIRVGEVDVEGSEDRYIISGDNFKVVISDRGIMASGSPEDIFAGRLVGFEEFLLNALENSVFKKIKADRPRVGLWFKYGDFDLEVTYWKSQKGYELFTIGLYGSDGDLIFYPSDYLARLSLTKYDTRMFFNTGAKIYKMVDEMLKKAGYCVFGTGVGAKTGNRFTINFEGHKFYLKENLTFEASKVPVIASGFVEGGGELLEFVASSFLKSDFKVSDPYSEVSFQNPRGYLEFWKQEDRLRFVKAFIKDDSLMMYTDDKDDTISLVYKNDSYYLDFNLIYDKKAVSNVEKMYNSFYRKYKF